MKFFYSFDSISNMYEQSEKPMYELWYKSDKLRYEILVDG
jgi:hypothetical protein